MENETWRDRFGSVHGGPVGGREERLGDDWKDRTTSKTIKGGLGRGGEVGGWINICVREGSRRS